MFINKKHIDSHKFPYRDFFNSCVIHVSSTCLRIDLFLVTLVLITTLLGMGALLGPMTQLIAVEAWLVVPWSC